MPIISIANIPENAVRSMLWEHITKILKLKLKHFNSEDQGDMSFELGIKPDYANKTIDTGNDDALSAQYGVEPLSKMIKNFDLKKSQDALVAAYYKKREGEHTLLRTVYKANNVNHTIYKELIKRLGISSHTIVLSKKPSREAICSGQNLSTYYIEIPLNIDFHDIESYLNELSKKGICAQAILETNAKFYKLEFTTPLKMLLAKLTEEGPITKPLIPPVVLAQNGPLTYRYTPPKAQEKKPEDSKPLSKSTPARPSFGRMFYFR